MSGHMGQQGVCFFAEDSFIACLEPFAALSLKGNSPVRAIQISFADPVKVYIYQNYLKVIIRVII